MSLNFQSLSNNHLGLACTERERAECLRRALAFADFATCSLSQARAACSTNALAQQWHQSCTLRCPLRAGQC